MRELCKEYVKVHELYLAAHAKLNEAREAHREFRERTMEICGVKENRDESRDEETKT